MKMKKGLLILLGCVCLGLGAVGMVVPVAPTTPFLLVTAYCFARSSEKLSTWFKNTELYKKHLDSFVKKEGMTIATKRSIMLCVTILIGIAFLLMARKRLWIPCAILTMVWLGHLWFFGFRVRTIENRGQSKP